MRLASASTFRAAVQLVTAGLLSTCLFAANVDLKQGKDQIDVVIDGRPFTTYYYGSDTAKAYLMPLRTASGIVISRPFPVGNDASEGDPKASSFEPHQRPLYFAHGDIDGLNFWGEAAFQKYYSDHSNQSYGHMAKASLKKAKKESDSAAVDASFSLEDPNGRSIADEDQAFAFRGNDRTRVIDCEFTLRATHGPIAIGDTKEGTFGIRLGKELSAPLVHMVNSHGAQGEPEIWGKPADWVNYYGTVSGHAVGIVVFDHPTSFRHPTTWHARAYGLLAANPFGLREFTKDAQKDGSWTVVEGSSLRFRYRVLIYDGVMDTAQIGEEYKRYAAEP